MFNKRGVKMKKVVIYGIGDFAKLIYTYLKYDQNREVSGFCVDQEFYKEKEFLNLPVITFEGIEDNFPNDEYEMIVTIGYRNMRNREKMYNKAKEKGYTLINLIHSKAIVNNGFQFGDNNIIMGNVNIEPNVKIGSNNIIWSDTLLGHDLIVGNNNYIAAKCLVAGNSKVGNLCFLGNNISMIDGLIIEDETYLISGSNLFRNTERCKKYSGTPAIEVGKSHEQNGIIIKR